MTSRNRQKEYISNRVMTASPMELVRFLYEASVQSVDEALAALHSGDILARGQAVNKAIETLAELRMSLRRDAQEEYSNTLAELYGYMQHQLIRAHAGQSESLLREVSRLLNTLLEGWSGAMDKLAAREEAKYAEELGHTADPVIASNPYSPEPLAPRLESRSWQL